MLCIENLYLDVCGMLSGFGMCKDGFGSCIIE